MHEIITGDCLEVMRTFPDNHFTGIVTDGPYGISFMSRGWDRGIPSIEYWQEMLRIVKPGGHLISAGLPRMMHRLISVIEDAGWEIRDLLMHLFGSGFPKSHNHFGIEGYGTALKPAWEGWSLAMKPLDGTFKQNAEKWGVAGLNIDGCRIPTTEELQGSTIRNDIRSGNFGSGHKPNPGDIPNYQQNKKGRWPANVIFDEEAAKMLDEQSGVSTSRPDKRSGPSPGKGGINCYSGGWAHRFPQFHNDSGGASRYFYCAKTSSRERNEGLDSFPMKKCGMMEDDNYAIKTGSGNLRDTQRRNTHPTVKPLKLMEYLIKLIAPPTNALILDPFAGSGSTILAAKRLGISAIGIEKQEEYATIARARVNAYSPESKDDEQMEFSCIDDSPDVKSD